MWNCIADTKIIRGGRAALRHYYTIMLTILPIPFNQDQEKALERAFSVIVKNQTSWRFISSSTGHWHWSSLLCTVSSRMAAFSFCPQFKWKRCSVVPVCGGPNQALCMAHSEIEWICSHLSHILEKSGFLRHWITERMFSCFTFNLLPIPSIEAICPLCLLAHYVASLPHIKLSI